MSSIIIIGAGIGGLCLGQGLKKAGIPFDIFERDTSKVARSQGYRLRISPVGSDALENCLNPDVWELFKRTCANTVLGKSFVDANTGEVLTRKPGVDPSRTTESADRVFTADRATMRDTLMTGIEPHIHFGKEFKKFTNLPNGQVAVEFADGTSKVAYLLVAADGRSSKVRRQYIPDIVPYDLESRAIYGKTPITPEFLDRFPANCLEWMTIISDKSLKLFLEPIRFNNPSVEDYIYWVLGGKSSAFQTEDTTLFSLQKEDIKQLTLLLTKNWTSSLQSIMELQSAHQTAALLISSALPKIAPWVSSNVTLLGDAIHPMLPIGGSGANTALRDAAQLCEVIKNGAKLEDIAEYEKNMREYAASVVNEALEAGKMMGLAVGVEDAKPLKL